MFSRRASVISISILAVLVMVLFGTASSQVPRKVNYQMRITDSVTGEPEPGPHELIFRVFEQDLGGTAVWNETHNVTADTTGVIAVILGSNDPFDIAFDGSMWLEVMVDGETLDPRREIVSVPYAFRALESDHAGDADSLGGTYSGDYIVAGDVGVVTSDMIADGSGSGLDADMLDGLNGDAYADSGHDHDDRYYMQDELDTAGSINDAGNPVDWTKLKNVPAGFTDGTDDVGGAGDGHSLDAVDEDPIDVVYVDAGGDVGIGTKSATANLHIYENSNDVVSLKIENPNTGVNSTERISFINENGDISGIAVYDDDSVYPAQMRIFNNRPGGSINLTAGALGLHVENGGDVGIGTTTPSQQLEVEGNIQADSLILGNISLDGSLQLFRSGTGNPIVSIDDSFDEGAVMWFREDGGMPNFKWEPDVSGGGGAWMTMTRATGLTGLTFDGNTGGSQDPTLTITGSSRFATFNMSSSGNSSVSLPVDAISSSEMFDEPGVASHRAHYAMSPMALAAGYNQVDSVSLYVPAAGYVLVLGTCQPSMTHTTGNITHANFGISTVRTSFPANQDISLRLDTNIGGGLHGSNVQEFPVSVHGLFQVGSAGTYEYFLLAQKYSGTIAVNDVQLSAVYFPTSYGSVSPTLAEGPQPAADESVGIPASERIDAASPQPSAEEIYMARIESEMAVMKAELEALKQELEVGNRLTD